MPEGRCESAKLSHKIQVTAAPARHRHPGRVFTDGERVVEVYYIEGSLHAQGFMMVYLPREKILIEADAFTPGPPNTPPPARPNDQNLNLVQNMERLNLQVEQILPLHGRMVTVTELYAAVGRKN